jgi:hypothetical protein
MGEQACAEQRVALEVEPAHLVLASGEVGLEVRYRVLGVLRFA